MEPSHGATNRWLAISAGSLAVMLGALDTYVVISVIRDIMSDINIGVNEIQKVTPIITSYLLGYIAAMPLLGRASDLHLRQVNERWMAALLVCVVAAVGLFKVARLHSATVATGAMRPGTHDIGRLFLGEWLLPFELISLVLLAALLGAVFFTRTENAP